MGSEEVAEAVSAFGKVIELVQAGAGGGEKDSAVAFSYQLGDVWESFLQSWKRQNLNITFQAGFDQMTIASKSHHGTDVLKMLEQWGEIVVLGDASEKEQSWFL